MNTAVALLVVAVIGGVVGGSVVCKYKNDQIEDIKKQIDDIKKQIEDEKNKEKKFNKMFGDMDLKNKNIKCHFS